jgi:HSP20 family molecular chaperone IbpA
MKARVLLLLLLAAIILTSLFLCTEQKITVTTEKPDDKPVTDQAAERQTTTTTSTGEQASAKTTGTSSTDVSTKEEWDMLDRYMDALIRDPFRGIRYMNKLMDSLLDLDWFDRPMRSRGRLWPRLFRHWEDEFRESLMPFKSGFDKIASTVDERDDKYIFKVVNVPENMKKENLNIKLTNDGYRDVLDITSDFKTEHESAFFERRYVFPSSVDREKVKAKFDEKERILTIEVPKKPDAFKTTNIMIE